MKTLRILLTISFTLTAASLVAQSRHYNSQTLGMGNGGTAFIDGYNANFLNPANLMINNSGRKPKTELGLFGGLGIQTSGSILNLDVYDEYLTNNLIIEGTVRENMLDDWFGSDVNARHNIDFNLDMVPFGFSYRGKNSAFSVATRVRTLNTSNVNRGFMELAFYGLDSDQFGDGKSVDLGFSTLSYAEISLGYAFALPLPLTGLIESLPFINGINVYAGVAPKYIIGLQAIDFNLTSALTVDPVGTPNHAITHQFDYSLTSYGDLSEQLGNYADARLTNPDAKLDDYLNYSGEDIGTLGSGFGLDLGVTAEIDISLPALGLLGKKQVLRVSMSMTDIGSVTYDDRPSIVNANDTFVFDGDAGNQSIGDYFDSVLDSLENDVYGGFTSEDVDEKKYDLPTMYNFGAALTLGKLTTTLDYGYAANEVGRNAKGSSLALGLEYRFFNFAPIRVGTRYGGNATVYSFGSGVDFRFVDITLGLMMVNDAASEGDNATFAWSGLVFRF